MRGKPIPWEDVLQATLDTLTMLGISTVFTVALGLPLGVLVFLCSKGQLLDNRPLYAALSGIINVLRSVPFVILMIALIPFTRFVMGTSIGVEGTIPPLVIGAAPFFARIVEQTLREVDRGVVEAAQAMGASPWQIVTKVLLPEARPGLIGGVTITSIVLVAYTAMSGMIGGGGLGDLAIRYGYQRFNPGVMIVTIILLLILVVILQTVGDRLVARYSRK
ncbi:methionine ABC transporter permease [Paenibacillus sp.]|uniref:methionine ABC transporter permease n=1 Tax=Paenibacillus sp. TaxID=58172 RepID=UPI002D6B3E7E|nr:methionine ABC transporter permease [Paenibacillus sp.]HZG86366.1 methionine ABC transporter permease [Paenibacillus sp.]